MAISLIKKLHIQLMLETFASLSDPLLKGVFKTLVYEDPIVRAEAIVILVGPINGCRINGAIKLFHEGFAEKLVFSGFEHGPMKNRNVAMKELALVSGVSESNIITENTDEEASTKGEGIANLKLLKKNNIKRFILLTSNFHTRRAKLVYKKLIRLYGYDMDFLVCSVRDPDTPMHGWWDIRNEKGFNCARRWVLSEYVKLIGFYLNL